MKLPCTCKHDYQDRKCGIGVRVHNANTKGSKCTVCGNQRSEGASIKMK